MFNIGFSSTEPSAGVHLPEKPSEKARNKRSRRRRNAKSRNKVEPVQANVPKKQHDAPMTKSDLYFALDCEMVGIGPDGIDSAVARVTIVNWENKVVLDTYVQVPVPVTDFRSHISGITLESIQSEAAMTLEEVSSRVETMLRGKILIGHGLECDLRALGLTHPWCDVRDTATYVPLMRETVDPETGKVTMRCRKLRDLAWEFLHRQIQNCETAHCPVEDAIAALDLYKTFRREWEEDLIRVMQEKEKQRQILEEQQRLRMKWWFSTPQPIPIHQQQAIPQPQAMPQNMPQQQLYQHQVLMPFVPVQDPRQVQGLNEMQVPRPLQDTPVVPIASYELPRNPPPYHWPAGVDRPYVALPEEYTPHQGSSSWFRFGSRRPKSPLRMPITEHPPLAAAASESELVLEAAVPPVVAPPEESGSVVSVRPSSPSSPASWFRFRRAKSPPRQDQVVPQLVQSEESAEEIFDLSSRPRLSTASTLPDDEWLQDMSQLEQELNNLVSI